MGCLWLTPVIPATQEAEIRRIKVQGQPRQIVGKTLSGRTHHIKKKKKKKKAGGVAQGEALNSNPSTTKKIKNFKYNIKIQLHLLS
jgi:hypothetical protein